VSINEIVKVLEFCKENTENSFLLTFVTLNLFSREASFRLENYKISVNRPYLLQSSN